MKFYIKYTQHEYDEENDVDSYHEEDDIVTADGMYGLLTLAESYGQIVHTIVRIVVIKRPILVIGLFFWVIV